MDTAMLDLELLRSFVSVVDAGGFTRAGERVHRTQSTVSQQIRRLEEMVGQPLLHRNGKQVSLTEQGERLLSYARRILTLEQEAISRRFATPGPKDFHDLAVRTAETGAPILSDCLAYVDCRVVEILPGGDHDIFIGQIVAGELQDGLPLLYYSGKYRRLADL